MAGLDADKIIMIPADIKSAPRDLLVSAGEALYGPQWQTAIAADLGVTSRTVRRWLAGEWPVPDDALIDLATLCRDRSKQLSHIARTMAVTPPHGAR